MAINWTERYGIHRARIGRVGDVEVAWDREDYKVSAFGFTLKQRARDADAGKALAVAYARKLMTDALAELG